MEGYLAPLTIGGAAYLAPLLPPASAEPDSPPISANAPKLNVTTIMRVSRVSCSAAALQPNLNLTGNLL